MIWCSESESKVSGGLGAAEALTVDRRAGETDCVDDSSLWRTDAVAAPRCKLRVSEGGSAEWHEDRRLGSPSPESTASAILIDQLMTWTHTRTRSVSLTLKSNTPQNRSSLGNQLYFPEAVKVASSPVNDRRFNYINFWTTPRLVSSHLATFFLLPFLWLMAPCASNTGFPSQSHHFGVLFPATLFGEWLRTRRSVGSHVYVFTSVRSHLRRRSPVPVCSWQVSRHSVMMYSLLWYKQRKCSKSLCQPRDLCTVFYYCLYSNAAVNKDKRL